MGGLELSRRAFSGCDVALMRYFGSTYLGRLANGVRNRPLRPQELRRSSGRADVGIARANSPVGSTRNAFASGLAQSDCPGARENVGPLQ